MLWSHAYGRLRVLWSRGCKIRVRFTCGLPRGLCGFHTGMGTYVRSVLRKPYGPIRMSCRLGNTRTISGARPYGICLIIVHAARYTAQFKILRNIVRTRNATVDATVSIGPSFCSVTDGHHFLSNQVRHL